MPSKKIWSLQRTFSAVETVLRYGMFQGSDEVWFIVLTRNSLRATCLYSAVDFEIFLHTTKSLPLKVLDFGLQMPTGPSSEVVACILLVSSRLDCPGMSLAEVCATCLDMSMWSFSGGVTLKCCSSKLFFQKI